MHLAHSGLSQVPLRRVGTFQSHNLVDGRSQAQRWRPPVVQTMARPPPGKATVEHGINARQRGARHMPSG